ncbi:hypothetical protein NDU88_006728 [Pleurodeles waltl]|uniref:Uncharacterized protein n=1 Tax=Pleurodeles waltl TaxID=8319 RepID=A0AAV7N4B5_PLEWA|nr:hypothetical protein NDU88_006728 [Pleurodeles waltl]
MIQVAWVGKQPRVCWGTLTLPYDVAELNAPEIEAYMQAAQGSFAHCNVLTFVSTLRADGIGRINKYTQSLPLRGATRSSRASANAIALTVLCRSACPPRPLPF